MPIGSEEYRTPPRPPTLEEIVKIFKISKHFNFSHNFVDDSIQIQFTVTKEDCQREGLHVNLFASVFLAELKDHLDRLNYFDDLVARYSNTKANDHRIDECMAFVNQEFKNAKLGYGPEGALRAKMLLVVMTKLDELKKWRLFVDQERFNRERAEAEKRKAEEEARQKQRDEFIRKAQEEMRRAQEEAMRGQRKGQAGQQKEDPFKSAFGDGTFGNTGDGFRYEDFEEIFRRYRADFGGFKQGEDTFRWGPGNEPGSRKRRNTKADLGGKNWWDILGVSVSATKAQINAAWRKLAKQHHPDREGGNTAKMAEINAARDEGLAGAAS